jgi:hypothetical protein
MPCLRHSPQSFQLIVILTRGGGQDDRLLGTAAVDAYTGRGICQKRLGNMQQALRDFGAEAAKPIFRVACSLVTIQKPMRG